MASESKKQAARPQIRPAPARRREEGHGGHGSWKVAYADFVTAMMAFFLLMWILHMVPPETKKALENFFKPEWDVKADGESANNPMVGKSDASRNRLSEEQLARFAVAQKLKKVLSDDPKLASSSGISTDDVGVLLRVNNDALFRPGTADPTPEALKVFAEAAELMRQFNFYLIVRGHADPSEAEGRMYASAWDLSAARAVTALRYLVERARIEPSRLRAIGYADTRPLLPDTSPENRAQNRRVEFYFHRPEIMNYQVVY